MKKLPVILFLILPLGIMAQPLEPYRHNFFTTNPAPVVQAVAGSNVFITYSTPGTATRTFLIDVPASGAATNVFRSEAGTNVVIVTNGFLYTISVPSFVNGTNGLNGTNGINGINGTNGVNGINGTNGVNGIDGTNAAVGLVTNDFTITLGLSTNYPSKYTNGYPWGVLYDPSGSAHDATNGFPWGVLYDPAGSAATAAQNATNGFPWGVLYDPAGAGTTAAQNATNGYPWTNVSFIQATQYVGANYLPLAGGTVSGPVLTTSSTTNGPSQNELATAGWVRGLFNVGADYYVTTVIDAVATNSNPGAGQPVYDFASTIPASTSRSYTTADFLTNNGYLGSVVTTNSFMALGGTVAVNGYLGFTGGSSTPTLTIHPEIYYSYDRTNWFGDFSGGTQAIAHGTTNIYEWAINFPTLTATNSTGFYVQRRFKCDSVTGAGVRTFTILIGTNVLSGVNDATHVTMQSPSATSGDAFLAANQTFTGTNTFTQTINGSITGNAATATTATNVQGGTVSGNGSGLTNLLHGISSKYMAFQTTQASSNNYPGYQQTDSSGGAGTAAGPIPTITTLTNWWVNNIVALNAGTNWSIYLQTNGVDCGGAIFSLSAAPVATWSNLTWGVTLPAGTLLNFRSSINTNSLTIRFHLSWQEIE